MHHNNIGTPVLKTEDASSNAQRNGVGKEMVKVCTPVTPNLKNETAYLPQNQNVSSNMVVPNIPYSSSSEVQALAQSQQYLTGKQSMLESHMCEMEQRWKRQFNYFKKEHKKKIEDTIGQDQKGAFYLYTKYNDGTVKEHLLILNASGECQVKVYILDNGCEFFSISIGAYVQVFGPVKKFTKSTALVFLIEAGAELCPQVKDSDISNALYKYFRPLIQDAERIKVSGLAGWYNCEYQTAESMEKFVPYISKQCFPVLKKQLDLRNANAGRLGDYKKLLLSINDEKNRLYFFLLPIAGILFSLLRAKNKDVPYLLNLVMATSQANVKTIAQFCQIFNRSREVGVFNAEMPRTKIQAALYEAKDEVLVFAGMYDEHNSNYGTGKITNNLHWIASQALGYSGYDYIEGGVKALVLLVSNQQLVAKGVRNIFVDDKFFSPGVKDSVQYSSVEAIITFFIFYVSISMQELDELMTQKSDCSSAAEVYWKLLIEIAERFLNFNRTSLSQFLSLSEDFKYEYLWEDEEYDIEDGVAVLVAAIRQAMPMIKASEKRKASDQDNFIYDGQSIWILTELFDKILEDQKLIGYKNQLLQQCKSEKILITTPDDTYTTRLQVDKSRRQYYRFSREAFNSVGKVEIIDLAGGDENA